MYDRRSSLHQQCPNIAGIVEEAKNSRARNFSGKMLLVSVRTSSGTLASQSAKIDMPE
jgi:hypothetical protein